MPPSLLPQLSPSPDQYLQENRNKDEILKMPHFIVNLGVHVVCHKCVVRAFLSFGASRRENFPFQVETGQFAKQPLHIGIREYFLHIQIFIC